jgi:hypothetical protein
MQVCHRFSVSRSEWLLIAAITFLLLLAVFGPIMLQPGDYHRFADQRTLLGIPHASDVLSNLPFALAGFWGLWSVIQPANFLEKEGKNEARKVCAGVFFSGLLATSVGSSWYHLKPDDLGLVIDRLSMAIAFAGLLGMAASERVSQRSGLVVLAVVMLCGPMSIWIWHVSANVLPWAIVQFGGLLLLVGLACVKRQELKSQSAGISIGTVVFIYGVAKAFEYFDQSIYEFTQHFISGHTLKHLVASLVIFAVLSVPAWSFRKPESKSEAPPA